MLRIKQSTTLSPQFRSNHVNNRTQSKNNSPDSSNLVILSLGALAVVGAAIALCTKKKTMTYEKALKKSGVEINDGIAKVVRTGKKFTGSIQRYETKDKQETVKFVDGKITEKVYHTASGEELKGYFYKNGELKISVSGGTSGKTKFFSFREYSNGHADTIGDACVEHDESMFEWARNALKTI